MTIISSIDDAVCSALIPVLVPSAGKLLAVVPELPVVSETGLSCECVVILGDTAPDLILYQRSYKLHTILLTNLFCLEIGQCPFMSFACEF